MISGYRLMWIMVMFDLPVSTRKEARAASQFRQFLLDEGFEMSQFSVYLRFCGDRSRVDPYVRRIRAHAPASGKISILFFTDKQFSDSILIQKRQKVETPEAPKQYELF